MSTLVADCPRCGTKKITFDVLGQNPLAYDFNLHNLELFSKCRSCRKSTVFTSEEDCVPIGMIGAFTGTRSITNFDGDISRYFPISGFISVQHNFPIKCPASVPDALRAVFDEAAACVSIRCFNAAGTMFRLCVDLATEALLPAHDAASPTISDHERRNLTPRLKWLFQQNRLPQDLRDLAAVVKEDGNDAAHRGTLTQEDAEDLLDFTVLLLERMYTEPERVRRAETRKIQRQTVQP